MAAVLARLPHGIGEAERLHSPLLGLCVAKLEDGSACHRATPEELEAADDGADQMAERLAQVQKLEIRYAPLAC